ncbi:heparan-sulfate 6-O-sulfotransferase 2 [Pieris napi]|uniref:heparan-sulfate 6-O-sulfotransferase 2 n=1 Tax=Pieris napi TaxID=78633 RepID=UPI001FBA8ECC|nr:heparan-sulfate 6-O-sulfotransferase 2 [Pieris napi]
MQSTEMQKSVSVQVDSDFALFLPGGVYEIKKMEPRSKLRKVILFCLLLSLFGMVAFGYFCPDQVCAMSSRERVAESMALSYAEAPGRPLPDVIVQPGLSYDEVLHDDFRFDLNAHDVMVFLHIQKTGGTSFGRHLVMDLDLKRPCNCQRARKRCHCFRPHSNEIWLFSRYSTGWKCGLHADFTELTACVGGELDRHEGSAVHRRYFYITLLREPVSRYLSEYRHVKRGATWKGSRHWCQGRTASASEVPSCYNGDSWRGVTLEEFTACSWNLANNRQTRMLADLALVGCYNGTLRHRTADTDRVLLASAKRNLAAMAYFGLTEFQKISQYVFEETFNLRFAVPFTQHNATVSGATLAALSPAQVAQIKQLNSLDLELYDFAKGLMFKRFEALRKRDSDFEFRWRHLGEVAPRSGVTEFDWDSNLEDGTTEKYKGK